MKNMRVVLILTLVVFSSCDYYIVKNYNERVGVIRSSFFNTDKSFQPCFKEEIFPYYYGRKTVSFAKGKDALRKYFLENYNSKGVNNESGYVTIRFIINCHGKAGRYEMHQLGRDFKKKKFNKNISDQLMQLTMGLQDWIPIEFYGDRYDSFYHLSFKIQNGELYEILP